MNTDYDEWGEYIVNTTANGVEIHGKCSPMDGAVMVGDFFECAKMISLPPSPDGTYTFVTKATPAVNENPHEGSYVYVEYMVDCEGTCKPPSAPPLPPSGCEYSATPAGVELYAHVGGSGGGEGGADGGWHVPSQSTMYSTYT